MQQEPPHRTNALLQMHPPKVCFLRREGYLCPNQLCCANWLSSWVEIALSVPVRVQEDAPVQPPRRNAHVGLPPQVTFFPQMDTDDPSAPSTGKAVETVRVLER